VRPHSVCPACARSKMHRGSARLGAPARPPAPEGTGGFRSLLAPAPSAPGRQRHREQMDGGWLAPSARSRRNPGWRGEGGRRGRRPAGTAARACQALRGHVLGQVWGWQQCGLAPGPKVETRSAALGRPPGWHCCLGAQKYESGGLERCVTRAGKERPWGLAATRPRETLGVPSARRASCQG
jgi:hypothetical protein